MAPATLFSKRARVLAAGLVLAVAAAVLPASQLQPTAEAAVQQLDVPYFSVRDTRWAGDRLGTCSGWTIRTAGCALTAVAMTLSYHRISVKTKKGTGMNPGILNAWLTENGGFASGCLLRWGRMPGVKYGGKDRSFGRLDRELAARRPVVAEVKGPNITSRHFVVITGKGNGTYRIRNPSVKTATSLSGYTVVAFLYFTPVR